MLRERENLVDIDPFDSCFLKFHFRECQFLCDSGVLKIVGKLSRRHPPHGRQVVWNLPRPPNGDHEML
jgi:hypothetical protein